MFKVNYKRKIIIFTIVLSILSLSMVGAKLHILEKVAEVFYENTQDTNEYIMNIDFDPEEKVLIGNQKITYTNHENTSFNSIYFHLYPNAFKTKEKVPFEKKEMKLAYPNGFEPGSIEIKGIRGEGETLNYAVMGVGDTILKVNLNKNLEPKEKIELEIDFFVKVPPSYGRFGYGENTMNIGNWYPIISVFDSQGWHLDPYYSVGDPFYSDIANYRVTISMPKEYILASSGNLVKKENIQGKIDWTVEGRAIRDFAMIISDKFKIMEDEIDGVKIYSYYIEDSFAELSLQTAKDAIKIFGDIYGKYPYPQFSVAASDFFIGGMEYPNLVFIDESLYKEEQKEILEYVIAHEAAHQWWYGLVGNDEVGEPWLDEALTEYSTLLYYEKKYGAPVKNEIYKNLIVKYYHDYRNGEQREEGGIYRSIERFKDPEEYQALVYYKGAMVMEDLRTKLGDNLFFQVMKVYFDKYKYKNANTEGFIKVCEQVSNKSLREDFRKWLNYSKE